MTKLRCRLVRVPAVLAALLLAGACNKAKDDKSRPIKEIMNKLNDGPQSLNDLLGQELRADSPEWGTIQQQTKEFAQLATSLGEYTPPKGSKESWAKLTTTYAESATALDKAAQAKDKKAAQAAHKDLGRSCMSCHREHRKMGGSGGG